MILGGNPTKVTDVTRRVGTTLATSNASTTSGTTELAVDQVTANVISGNRYVIRWVFKYTGTSTADQYVVRIREGSGTGGAEVDSVVFIPQYTANNITLIMDVDWGPAVSTTSRTWTGTVQRISGTTSTVTPVGGSTFRRRLTVELAD
ncbi:hypothetical protein Ato02nite_005400 [Paractinoplanes toevensis]|uniref:Uncharacterized protein n=1 Tax=Paractinoplanes toevensis TaxID=571911 RepID=A0A919T4Z0_9ACTN|nr:hypothetical protein Ato02nite_005400 [Actinoplanes toevensis]